MNTLKATGPTSAEGKAISCMNAVKTGIYAAPTTLLPNEDAAQIQQRHDSWFADCQPVGPKEETLVEMLFAAELQVNRCNFAEGILAKKALDPSLPIADAVAALYEQPRTSALANLNRQRKTAINTWFRALKELEHLQKQRKLEEAKVRAEAGKLAKTKPAQPEFVPATPAPQSAGVPTPTVAPDIGR